MFSHVKFTELPVIDQDRAKRFYVETLELDLVTDTPYHDDWRWIEIGIPGAATRILFVPGRSLPLDPEAPSLVLVSNDVEETSEKLLKRGVRFDQIPTPAPWDANETYALFRDSEENIVMIGSG